MIIGACGFSWSGSSAVRDFLMEFNENDVYAPEFLLAYYPDGLIDLDYHLNSNNSKAISSVIAIERFKNATKHLLYRATEKKIDKITQAYLNQLIQVNWVGAVQGLEVFYNEKTFVIRAKMSSIMRKFFSSQKVYDLKFFPLREVGLSIKPNNFQEITYEYVDRILDSIGLDLKKNIVLDQPFPGNSPSNAMKYFRDSYAVVVDRDPRDYYVLIKKFFSKRGSAVPHDTVDNFILFYKLMHKEFNVADNDRIIHIQFEDMVYNYETTANFLTDKLGLKSHDCPKKFFNPEVSQANTMLYLDYEPYTEIEQIENELSEWLYDFSKCKKTKNKSIKVFDESPTVVDKI